MSDPERDVGPENPHDLIAPINAHVLKDQARPSGQAVLFESDGVVHQYFHDEGFERAKRFARLLEAEVEWIESFVKHAPTVGNHYESLLRDLLAEYLPSSVRVGTGFVYDSATRQCSPQLDILVYSDHSQSPIHRRGEFVIVDPAQVRGVREVKKTLRSGEIEAWIGKTVGHNLGHGNYLPNGVQRAGLFAYSCDISTESLAMRVQEAFEAHLRNFTTRTRQGIDVVHPIFKISLPGLYIKDRSEYISVGVRTDEQCRYRARAVVSILRCDGAGGVSPFLGAMDPEVRMDPGFRDFVSPLLVEVVKEISIECSFALAQRISSAEMIRRFPDAKCRLGQQMSGGRPYGAIVSAFVDLDEHQTLGSLSLTDGFSWEMWKG